VPAKAHRLAPIGYDSRALQLRLIGCRAALRQPDLEAGRGFALLGFGQQNQGQYGLSRHVGVGVKEEAERPQRLHN
jgi:hypothetical protein